MFQFLLQVSESGFHQRAVCAALVVACVAAAGADCRFGRRAGAAGALEAARTPRPNLRSWRAWAVWGMQSAFVALVLLLLWQPAITVAALSSQQNIIAVVVDDSRSMAIADSDGKTREAAALAALEDGVSRGLQKRFQTRIYRLDSGVARVDDAEGHRANGGRNAHRRWPEAAGDGDIRPADWSGSAAERWRPEHGRDGRARGLGVDALEALRNRRLPVHTIGFGSLEQCT